MSEREERIVDRAARLFSEAVADAHLEQAEQALVVAFAVARERDEPPLEDASR